MYKNKKILVCGVARSGISVSKLLIDKGASVTLYDKNTINYHDEKLKFLINNGVKVICLDTPINIIENFDLIVLSPGIPLHLDFVLKAYQLSIPVVSEVEVCATLTNNNVIAITGTNGKTTCTTLIGEILKSNGNEVEVVGNIGIPFSERLPFEKDNTIYALELSSYQLETTYSLKPKVSVVINISPDHLERHKTYENYIVAKKRIFQNSDEEDFLVLNYDDEICKNMSLETKSKVFFFSKYEALCEGAYIKNDKIYVNSLFLEKEQFILDLTKIKLLGEHNVENILATVSALYCIGINYEILRDVIYKFKGVEHRMELVNKINDIIYINDSKSTNEASTVSAINSFSNNIVLVLGGYGNTTISQNLIDLIKESVKHLILIGESKSVIQKTLNHSEYNTITIIDRLEEINNVVEKICVKNDVLLFSPGYKSKDMFKNYEERGKRFKEVVNKIEV